VNIFIIGAGAVAVDYELDPGADCILDGPLEYL
jgi:hypothetical protein